MNQTNYFLNNIGLFLFIFSSIHSPLTGAGKKCILDTQPTVCLFTKPVEVMQLSGWITLKTLHFLFLFIELKYEVYPIFTECENGLLAHRADYKQLMSHLGFWPRADTTCCFCCSFSSVALQTTHTDRRTLFPTHCGNIISIEWTHGSLSLWF